MRILLLTHGRAWESGTFVRALSLGKALAALGHAVTLLSARRDAGRAPLCTELDGVRTVQMPGLLAARVRGGGLSPDELLARLRFLHGQAFDVIHCFEHRPTVALSARFLCRNDHAVLVRDWADLWGANGYADSRSFLMRHLLGKVDHYGERAFTRRADGVTVISRYLHAETLRLGVDPDRICYLPVGATPPAVPPPDKATARRQLGLPVARHLLLYIGIYHHDIEMLIAMLPHLLAQAPDAQLVLVGPGLLHTVARLEAAGLGDHVLHVGQIAHAELGAWLAAGDVMLLPYVNNVVNVARFPQRFGDYIAAGRPIVTNPTGDLGALVRAQGIGVLAADNPVEFAATVARLLADPVQMRAMGRRAFDLAHGAFSWQTLGARVLAFYAGLMA
ncbi:MAG: glycosyltransferase family 4 protein [Caldilineaceae bacterium]|nr:glycosyltransferase family 4 protein [Caldilineaceae bacterium]